MSADRLTRNVVPAIKDLWSRRPEQMYVRDDVNQGVLPSGIYWPVNRCTRDGFQAALLSSNCIGDYPNSVNGGGMQCTTGASPDWRQDRWGDCFRDGSPDMKRPVAKPEPASRKVILYAGWSTNNAEDKLNEIANAQNSWGGPAVTNLHIIMDYPGGGVDLNNPVPSMTLDNQYNSLVDPDNPSRGIKADVYGDILQRMRKNGTSVILCMLGGHGDLGPRTPLTSEGTFRMAKYLTDFVQIAGWDGLDFDEEYYKYEGSSHSGAPFLDLIISLRNLFNQRRS